MPLKRQVVMKDLQTKELLKKVFRFFAKEASLGKAFFLSSPLKRLSRATGITETTIRRYVKDHDPVQDVVKAVHKKNIQTVSNKLSYSDEGTVRRIIHGFYMDKQMVTMPKVHAALKERGIDVSLSTVVRTVKKLGFRYYKKGFKQRFLSEQQDVVSRRHTYLRKIRKFRQEGRNTVYVGETCLNTDHVVKGDSLDHPSTSKPEIEASSNGLPSDKDTRIMILSAGSTRLGLIPGCDHIFELKSSSLDYQDELFTKWFKDKLIPRLLPHSVIVLDYAYHRHLVPTSQVPTTGSKKSEILRWLKANNVLYEKEMVKAELLDLVKQHKPCSRYVIEDLASDHGHEVLRIPPHHCELNPIEMVWSYFKGYMGRQNSSITNVNVTKLFEEAKSHFNVEHWAKFESHVVNEVEANFWHIDGVSDEDINSNLFDAMDIDDNEGEIDGDEGNDLDNSFDEESFPVADIDDDLNNSGQSDFILCKICNETDPPKADKNEKIFEWFQCNSCDQWVHNLCCSKAAKKKAMCNPCHSVQKKRKGTTE